MTKRYYYTDPLKTAWMRKEHGIKFELRIFDVDIKKIACHPLDDDLLKWPRLELDTERFSLRYYVHPGSYELLEARRYDSTLMANIRFNEAIPPVLCVYEPYQGDYKIITGFREVTYKDFFSNEEHKETFEIIHRDNKVWFDPEVENG